MKLSRCIILHERLSSILFLCGLINAGTAAGTLPDYDIAPQSVFPSVCPGSSIRLIVNSAMLDDQMTVDIWFPPAYNTYEPDGFSVIYAHDGQNLFDPALSFSTVAWELNMTTAELVENGEITAPIIVGIYNRGAKNLRSNDYFPEKALSYIPDDKKSESIIWETCSSGFFGDEHAAFVATELKPLIDNLFNTNSDCSHTFVLGSSMGGLSSLYLMCEYPDIFGGAVCMSTHWIGSFKMNPDYTLTSDPICAQAILDYMDDRLPDPFQRKLYLDQGTTGWDADYLEYEAVARNIATSHGYDKCSGTLMTYNAPGAGHNEWFWQQRAFRPLTYLLKNPSGALGKLPVDETAPSSTIYNLLGYPVTGTFSPGIYVRDGKKFIIR